jgi:hypothetical protein
MQNRPRTSLRSSRHFLGKVRSVGGQEVGEVVERYCGVDQEEHFTPVPIIVGNTLTSAALSREKSTARNRSTCPKVVRPPRLMAAGVSTIASTTTSTRPQSLNFASWDNIPWTPGCVPRMVLRFSARAGPRTKHTVAITFRCSLRISDRRT